MSHPDAPPRQFRRLFSILGLLIIAIGIIGIVSVGIKAVLNSSRPPIKMITDTSGTTYIDRRSIDLVEIYADANGDGLLDLYRKERSLGYLEVRITATEEEARKLNRQNIGSVSFSHTLWIPRTDPTNERPLQYQFDQVREAHMLQKSQR